jgi:hypothetical protein
MRKNFKNMIFSQIHNEYGDDNKAQCLEIYKIYVERTDAISSRRESANTFFLSINTVLIGFISYIDKFDEFQKLALGVAGLILNYFWYRLLLSYKQLNSAKFRVIHEIEKKLPLSPYYDEWEYLGRGKDSKKYKPFTHIEIWVPRVFMALHVIAIIFPYRKYILTII